eukprot:2661495-Amphidinium_carterae.1
MLALWEQSHWASSWSVVTRDLDRCQVGMGTSKQAACQRCQHRTDADDATVPSNKFYGSTITGCHSYRSFLISDVLLLGGDASGIMWKEGNASSGPNKVHRSQNFQNRECFCRSAGGGVFIEQSC